jgi:Asp-tRNA(Asn)/Glu-tRNA(Gln) amidotransferase A subunit family amidase
MSFELSTERAVSRIRARESTIHAYVTTRTDEALSEARVRAGEKPRSALHGVPYGLKDEWDTAGIATTGGSHRHRDRVPHVDSDVARVFRDSGAVLVGKTNLSDLGLSPESSSWVGGSTRNPHDLRRTAGGSSGGAAAAVADGMQAFDWGTDIGGSIRLPAAFCGIYGLRLSSETWPITSLFPNLPKSLASMCGQGPMTKTLPQMKTVLDVARPVIRSGPSRSFALRGAYLHVPTSLGEWPSFVADVQPAISRAVEGPVVPRAPLPSTDESLRINASLWSSHLEELLEADPTIEFGEGVIAVLSSLLLRGSLGDRRFHPRTAELLLLILLGRYTLYTNSERAKRQGKMVKDAFYDLFDRGYVVVSPVVAYPAPIVGRTNYNMQILANTVPGNIADATGLAVPFGRFKNGMPRAIQLLGPAGSESALIEIAEKLQSA